jgi:hypothetical protein
MLEINCLSIKLYYSSNAVIKIMKVLYLTTEKIRRHFTKLYKIIIYYEAVNIHTVNIKFELYQTFVHMFKQ